MKKKAMSTSRRIIANFLSLTTAEVVSKALQLLVFVYIARLLGKEDFGIFTFGFSFAMFISIVADFGLSTLLVREISRNLKKGSIYISNALTIKVLLSFCTLFITFVFLTVMGYSTKIKIVAFIMVVFAIIQSYTELFYAVFRAFERMHFDAFVKVFRMILLVVLVYYVMENNPELILAVLIFPLIELAVLLLAAFFAYKKFIRLRFSFNFNFCYDLLKKSSLFCLSLVFAGLLLYIDVIMLSKLRSTAEVGIYAAATNIIVGLIFIPMMYGNAIFPVLSRFYVSSKKSLSFAYARSFKYMLILGLAISGGIYMLSQRIILILYGEEYRSSAVALSILCIFLFLRFLNVISGFSLSSINKQGSRVFSQGVAAGFNIILNLFLIPFYGLIGAAIATAITEIVFFFLYTFFIRKYGLGINIFKVAWRPVIAVGIMMYSVSFLGNIVVTVVGGAVIYFGVLFVLGAIDKEDKRIWNNIIKNF